MTRLYFILVIIIPIIYMLIKEQYLYAGIWVGVGSLILFLDKTKIGKQIRNIIF
jgi:hypothetical protein